MFVPLWLGVPALGSVLLMVAWCVLILAGRNPLPFPDVGSRILSRLGISADVAVRIPSRGTEAVAMVARGDVVLAVQPVSEILNVPGVEFAGTIPTDLQHATVYAAAIVVGSKEPAASKRLIAFLSSDGATAAIRKSGMEPSPRQ